MGDLLEIIYVFEWTKERNLSSKPSTAIGTTLKIQGVAH